MIVRASGSTGGVAPAISSSSARRDEVADRAVALQQRRIRHDVWRKAGASDRVERVARARHVTRHHVRVDDIAMRVERRRNSFGCELRERAQRALQLPPLRRLADLVRELGGAVVRAGPRHRSCASVSSEASVEASTCGAHSRERALRSSVDEKRISAGMAEATPALYRWQGKKGVVDAELAKSHVWAAEGDEFCVQDSKPHALLVSVEGVPGLSLITPDEAPHGLRAAAGGAELAAREHGADRHDAEPRHDAEHDGVDGGPAAPRDGVGRHAADARVHRLAGAGGGDAAAEARQPEAAVTTPATDDDRLARLRERRKFSKPTARRAAR